LKQSSEVAEIQKMLYSKLTKCIVDCLPRHWNQQWLRDSDLLSPSSLPHKSQDARIVNTHQAVDSMHKDVENLRQNIIHISEDLHQWNFDMKQLEQAATNLLSSDFEKDVAECYDSDDHFNDEDTMNKWEPFSHVPKPHSSSINSRKDASGNDWTYNLPSNSKRCRKIGNKRLHQPDLKRIKQLQHKLHRKYAECWNRYQGSSNFETQTQNISQVP